MKNIFMTSILLVGLMLVTSCSIPGDDLSLLQLKPEARQVRLDIQYKGVQSKWFADLENENIRRESGKIGIPSATVKEGEEGSVELLRPYSLSRNGPLVYCGVIVKWTAKSDGTDIFISGKTVLRRATNKGAGGIATQFEANENLIDLKLEHGTPKAVNLAGGGQMLLTATLIDATGRPKKIGEQAAPSDGDKPSN